MVHLRPSVIGVQLKIKDFTALNGIAQSFKHIDLTF